MRMSDTNPAYIAFFDVDHTLIPENSGKSLIMKARRSGLMRKRDFLQAVYLALLFKLNWRDPRKIIVRMAAWLGGVVESELEAMVRELFADRLSGVIPREIYEEIQMHRERGARLVILSASMPAICHEFANHLGMDDVICSEFEVINGRYTGRTNGPFCYGPEKLVQMNMFCERSQCILEKSYFYSDSISDLPALERVGNPICVNPDKQLLKIAVDRSWEMRRWS